VNGALDHAPPRAPFATALRAPCSRRYDERFAVERLVVARFVVERFAVERFAVDRLAVGRDFDAARLVPPDVEARFVEVFFPLARFAGTLAPFSRASESPMAIACFLLVTVPPCPDLPRLSVPFFRRCIALFTDLPAAGP
jgi:hypothetical protein